MRCIISLMFRSTFEKIFIRDVMHFIEIRFSLLQNVSVKGWVNLKQLKVYLIYLIKFHFVSLKKGSNTAISSGPHCYMTSVLFLSTKRAFSTLGVANVTASMRLIPCISLSWICRQFTLIPKYKIQSAKCLLY